MAEDIEAHIEGLYRLPPDEFVAERDRLARAVRAAGDREGAKEISAQRRPTLAAWALDQLRDRDPDGLDRLAEVGESLRREQDRALAGDRDADLRGAGRDRRAVIGRLAGEAVAALREIGRGAEQQLDTVNAVLAAAITDPELLERIRAGRLVSDEVPASSGLDDPFAVFATGAATATKPPPPATTTRPAKADKAAKAGKAAKAAPTRPDPRLERARAAAEAADAALDEAESASSQAAEGARRAKRRVEELERELSRARREADKQVAAATKARTALAGAGRKRAQAHRTLEKVLDRRPPGREE